MPKKVRNISIDGGGVRGILTGTILTYIEDQLKKEYEQATIGKYCAQKTLSLYFNQGDEILDLSFKMKLRSVGGILDEKYSEKELEEALNEYLKDTKLSEVLKPSLYTS